MVKESEQRMQQAIENHGKEINELIFRVKNNIHEFEIVKEQLKQTLLNFTIMEANMLKSK